MNKKIIVAKLPEKSVLAKMLNPIIFVVVCALAIIALNFMQDSKAKFDKAQSSPIIVVNDDETRDYAKSDSVWVIKKNDLGCRIKGSDSEKPFQKILNLIDTQNNYPNNDKNAQNNVSPENIKIRNEVVSDITNDIAYQEFKNPSELLSRLSEAVSAEKETKLKVLQSIYDRTLIDQSAADEQESKALIELDERVAAQTNPEDRTLPKYIDIFIKGNTDKIPYQRLNIDDLTLDAVLKELNKTGKVPPKKIDDIKTDVRNYYEAKKENKRRNAEEAKAKLNSVNDIFPPITKNIYDSKAWLSERTTPQANEAQIILDEKAPLNVVYTLFRYLFLAVIVFALLYIILIPVKRIFFMTEAGSVLNEKGKGSLEAVKSSSAAALLPLTNAIITTVTIITIGAAVIIAGEYAKSPGNKANNESNVDSEPTLITNKPKTSKPGKEFEAELKRNQLKIDEMTASINNLKKTVSDFNEQMADFPIAELKALPGKVDTIGTQVNNVQNTLNNPENPADNTTVMAHLSDVSGKIGNNIDNLPNSATTASNQPKTLFAAINAVSGNIGGQIDDKSLSDNLREVSNSLGTGKYTSEAKTNKNYPTIYGNLQTVHDTVGKFSPSDLESNNPAPKTLVEYAQKTYNDLGIAKTSAITTQKLSTETKTLVTEIKKLTADTILPSISKIDSNTTDLGRFIFGSSDGNIITQFKTLFSRERFQVTNFAVQELTKISGCNDSGSPVNLSAEIFPNNSPLCLLVKKDLPALTNREKLKYSELIDNLPNLEKLDKDEREKWEQLIIIYTRIPRR
jgi:hypothetical protein